MCQKLCQEAEARHVGDCSIALPHCPSADTISSSAAQAKVDGLKSYQVRSEIIDLRQLDSPFSVAHSLGLLVCI